MANHAEYRFSVTIKTEDRTVVGCLRSIALISQKTGNVKIPWGGTSDDNWRRDGGEVTFRFTLPAYRDGFLAEVERLLPRDLWSVVSQSDKDPARAQPTH